MSASNFCQFIGNPGANPRIYKNPSTGSKIARFQIATTERKFNKEAGVFENKTEWHKIVAYGLIANNIESNVKKGQLIILKCSAQNYFHKKGVRVTEFRVQEFIILKQPRTPNEIAALEEIEDPFRDEDVSEYNNQSDDFQRELNYKIENHE